MTNLTDMLSKFVNSNTASTSGSGTLPSNTITNPKVDLKGITTRSGVTYQGPTIPTTTSSPPKVVERETANPIDVIEMACEDASMPNPKPSIPYPSRRIDEKRHEKANDQVEKFYKIFQDMSFEISLADALILMPKFASTLKALIGNKEKLSEMARTPLNEHCSACSSLADLGAKHKFMPIIRRGKCFLLPSITPTCLGDFELADQFQFTKLIGIAEDVYLKVLKFKFPADFVVIDFDADPRVPLIFGRSFLKIRRYFVVAYEGELTLWLEKKP
ncbi:hypothetical protein Tco_0673130 [Tanacetum coccineum]